ncbi:Chloroperoxidase [Chytriomyces sp. MP71]|nr:Chloroperoxidase [Chytriomyces sp. MP71]
MKTFPLATLAVCLAFPAIAIAAPHSFSFQQNTDLLSVLPEGEYQKPMEGDLRGPCPALNTLANHGYIPRNGRFVTEQMLLDALPRVLGLGYYPAKAATVSAFALKDSTWFPGVRDKSEVLEDGTAYLNLDDLNMHGRIEHDASLTRSDAYFGDNFSVNATLLQQFKAASTDGKVVTRDDIAKYRVARAADSREHNPENTVGDGMDTTSWGEASLALMIFGNSDEISIDHIDSFFGQEKIPKDYMKPDPEVGLFALRSHIADLKKRAIGVE